MDEDPVCPIPAITEACKPHCTKFWDNYKACAARIEKKGEGECEPWYFDYLHCIDKCVSFTLYYMRSASIVIMLLIYLNLQRVPQIMKHVK